MTAAPNRKRPRTLHHEPEAVTWARHKAGLTKRALARQVGISEQLIGEIESGWRSATPANLAKIATALNCPLVFLERQRPHTAGDLVTAPDGTGRSRAALTPPPQVNSPACQPRT